MNTEILTAQILETVQRCERDKLKLHVEGYITEAGDVYNFTLELPGAAAYPTKLAEQEAWLSEKIAGEADWAPESVPAAWLSRKDEVIGILQQELQYLRAKQASFQAKPPVDCPAPEYHNSAFDKDGFVVLRCCNQLRKFLLRVGPMTKLSNFKKSVLDEAPLGKSFCFQLKLAPTKFSALRVEGESKVLTCC